MQIEGVFKSPPEQYQPRALPEQSDLHFDEPSKSPSSQNSLGVITLESPHIG